MFDKLDINSQNSKYIATFLVSALTFFILSPGTIIEIDPFGDQKCKIERKTKLATSGIHSILFGALMLAFYYFYLNKKVAKFGII